MIYSFAERNTFKLDHYKESANYILHATAEKIKCLGFRREQRLKYSLNICFKSSKAASYRRK